MATLTTASASWDGDERFRTRGSSGHEVRFDADRNTNRAPGPMEMVLRSLCACSATDVVIVLQKMRQHFNAVEISAEGERAPDPPQVYTRIHMKYRIAGAHVERHAAERAVELSQQKYCSVLAMLKQSAAITHELVLEEAAAS